MLDCLKKGVKIASQCMDPGTKVQLLVELVNKYMYFYEKGLTAVGDSTLQELLDRIAEELPSLEAGDEADQVNQHLNNTVLLIKLRQQGSDEPRYAAVKVV